MNINIIKNELNRTVDNLPIEDKTDIYFESRKKSLKHFNHGEVEAGYKEVLRGDKLYTENRHDARMFHEAHHKYLEYTSTYDHFKYCRTLLLAQIENYVGIINCLT